MFDWSANVLENAVGLSYMNTESVHVARCCVHDADSLLIDSENVA